MELAMYLLKEINSELIAQEQYTTKNNKLMFDVDTYKSILSKLDDNEHYALRLYNEEQLVKISNITKDNLKYELYKMNETISELYKSELRSEMLEYSQAIVDN